MICKTIDRPTRAQLHRILDAVIDLNNSGNATFVKTFGHTGQFDIEVFSGEWEREKNGIKYEIHMAGNGSATQAEKLADTLEDTLEKIAPTK